jgi:hypothetical protein
MVRDEPPELSGPLSVPGPVRDLVTRMLAFDRDQRPEDGAAAHAELAALLTAAAWPRHAFLGRARPLVPVDDLRELQEHVTGPRRGVAIVGPSGAGKARRVEELVLRGVCGEDVVWIRADDAAPVGLEVSASLPLGALRTAIEKRAGVRVDHRPEQRREALARRARELFPDAAIAASALEAVAYPDRGGDLPMAMVRWLAAEGLRGACLVIEDAQRLDASSVVVLSRVKRWSSGALTVIALSPEPREAADIAAALDLPVVATRAPREDDALAFAMDAVPGCDPAVAAAAWRWSAERFLAFEAQLRSMAGWRPAPPSAVSDDLADVVAGDLAGLDPRSAWVARAAAAFGASFSREGVRAVIQQLDVEEIELGLARLAEHEVIVAQSPRSARGPLADYEFKHAAHVRAARRASGWEERAAAEDLARAWVASIRSSAAPPRR